MIDEAESMLTVLAEDVAEHGGQQISVEPLPAPAPAPVPGGTPAGDTTPDIAPVPAVSKVTLLAPDSVSGLAAVPASSAMPAVQVTPIPVDEPAVAGTSGEDTSTQSIAAVQADSGVQPVPDDNAVRADEPERADEAAPSGPSDEARAADDTSTTALTVVDAKSR
jgi:hypothetical protein